MDTWDQFLGQSDNDEPLMIGDVLNGVSDQYIISSHLFVFAVGQSKSCNVGRFCLCGRVKQDCHGTNN